MFPLPPGDSKCEITLVVRGSNKLLFALNAPGSSVDISGTCIILITLLLVSFVITTGTEPFVKFAKLISSALSNSSEDEDEDEEAEEDDDIKINGADEPEEKKKKNS